MRVIIITCIHTLKRRKAGEQIYNQISNLRKCILLSFSVRY